MKVITEKELDKQIEIANKMLASGCIYDIRSLKDYFLEEIDTLTVSKLRPMGDAPKTGESFLVCFAGSNRLHEGYFDTLGNVWVGDQYYSADLCNGWIPIPTYKPEKE